MRERPDTDGAAEVAWRRAPAAARRLYRAVAEDPRYGHYVRIPRRVVRCLEHFDVAADRRGVARRLHAYYLFIGVADDALDAGGVAAGGEVLRHLRVRSPAFGEEARSSRVRLVTEVFKCHVAPGTRAAVLAKLERLYGAAVREKEAATMAAYIEQRRAVGRLTADVSYLLIRPLLAHGRDDLRRFLREVGEVGCLVDSAIDLRSDGRLGLLKFKPAAADHCRLVGLTLLAGLRVLAKHPRLAGLFLEAVGDDLLDRLWARHPEAAGPELKVSGLEFRV